MIFFFLVGIYNSIVAVINFFKLFKEQTFLEASAILPTAIILAIVSFAIFSLLQKIDELESDIAKAKVQREHMQKEITELKKQQKEIIEKLSKDGE